MSEATRDVATLAGEVAGRLLAFEGVHEKPMWGEQGFLRGSRVFARVATTPDGVRLALKAGAAARGQTGVAPHPDGHLRAVGWVVVTLRDVADLDASKSLLEAAHAAAAHR
jgi:hypothetical protein